MKVGVLSDTHGSLYHTNRALSYMEDCDHILHLGDVLYHGPRNPVHDSYTHRQTWPPTCLTGGLALCGATAMQMWTRWSLARI
ncbi:metallophosphoesterase family protein [Peptococcus simiae]|uniref:metallophosphoesterase family protein n=1 Tax=Peptococcus simiae TaxID=1643805 RepID=UPI00398065C6